MPVSRRSQAIHTLQANARSPFRVQSSLVRFSSSTAGKSAPSTAANAAGEEPQVTKREPETWLERMQAASTSAADANSPPRMAAADIATSGAVSFAGMSLLSLVHFGLSAGSDFTMILGSMGASAVLVYAAPNLPLAQPRNVVGGHLVSTFVGVTTYSLLGSHMWLAVPVATSGAIMGMLATKTVHPPAGGTVLIALMGSAKIQALGYALLFPVGLTSGLIALSGVALNNILKSTARRYPTFWW